MVSVAACALATFSFSHAFGMCATTAPHCSRGPFPLCLSLQPVVDAIAGRGAVCCPLVVGGEADRVRSFFGRLRSSYRRPTVASHRLVVAWESPYLPRY